MKVVILCLITFCLSAMPVREAKADMDPKVKALATMAAYGTISGALLGTASLAFGTDGRSVAIGASLGLYAGLLFGTYVIVTHEMKKGAPTHPKRDNYYPNAPTPYNAPYGSGPYGDDEYGGGDYGGNYDVGQYHNPMWLEDVARIQVQFGADYFDNGSNRAFSPAFQMELMRISF